MGERLLLWDIDGTLVRAGDLGAAVFDTALEAVLGAAPVERVAMSGKTDPQIVGEYLTLMEVDDPSTLPAVLAELERELFARRDELRAVGTVLPGVAALLARLAEAPSVHQSVLTGNIAPNALVKLAAFGLDRYLDLEAGAYGSDHADRRKLVPIALRRQRDLRQRDLSPEDVWVIGDTPNDLACARAGGARCLLVATGRYGLDDLRALAPDAVAPDCGDLERLVALLSS